MVYMPWPFLAMHGQPNIDFILLYRSRLAKTLARAISAGEKTIGRGIAMEWSAAFATGVTVVASGGVCQWY